MELDADISVDNSNGNGKQGRPIPSPDEGVQLIKAFCRINRTETRQLILKLVETMAESIKGGHDRRCLASAFPYFEQNKAVPVVDRLRQRGESFSDVILRLVEIEAGRT